LTINCVPPQEVGPNAHIDKRNAETARGPLF
jgi:hypothetical protein